MNYHSCPVNVNLHLGKKYMDTSDRKAWEKAQRKKRLVDIAEQVFFSKGFDGTTMPMIADAAGYNKRTIYLYFKDKEELFLSVVLRGLKRLFESLRTVSQGSDAAGSGLRPLGAAFFDFGLAHPEYLDLMMLYEARTFIYYETETANGNQDYRSACQKVSTDIAQLVLDVIAGGIEKGIIHTPLTPRQMMLILWGQIWGVMQILRIREKHFDETFGIRREQLFEQFIEMTEKALIA
jgi:AcrR family transcriptional regulator